MNPLPTKKFLHCGIYEQVINIIEEVGEVGKELRTGSRDKVAEELSDVIFSAYTALEILGYNEKSRCLLFQMTYEKNKKRGYYD